MLELKCQENSRAIAQQMTSGGSGADVSVTQVLSSGTKIATIEVDDVSTDLYCETVPSTYDADDVVYDNTTSGLTATDVQSAIDEIVQGIGDNSHDYSTTEQVVGKWIDGTTDVYEKVFTGVSLTLNGSEWVIYSGADYIDEIIYLDAFATVDDVLVRCAISEYRPSPANGIQVSGFSGMNRTIDTMIVRYTKVSTP